ncbi:hypothetical protein [Pseudoclavibacter helvolus]|uniref:hypothetical protein n=1 Tax=Pseudoclavibacter helvolus TaxID=255205 RepID=UPI003C706E8F
MTVTQPMTDLALTTWSAPNPFGEPTAFALVHPVAGSEPSQEGAEGRVAEIVSGLGMKRLDASGDILPIGTDVLYASLRALKVELCTPSGVWLDQAVSDEWTGHAVGRRYVVLAVGARPLSDDAGAREISEYLAETNGIHAALVKIRVRFQQS